ncbi:DUF6907 domain-containing protein, partial [Streptomyces sp. CA2R106]|uniref:DUF6907 domain-containing protein n=1 Tax=Streptomyces sp. CA2R106 TaxID=3120153 RepID=UPI00300B3D05
MSRPCQLDSGSAVTKPQVGVGAADGFCAAHDPVQPPATLDIEINGTRYHESTSLMFAPQIACHPYSTQPHQQVPTASLTIVEEWDFEGLTPADLARFATQIRTQADYFETTLLPALTTAREDWT